MHSLILIGLTGAFSMPTGNAAPAIALAPIVFDLPIPSGAAIILVAGIAFALAAIARGVVPSLKGNLG